jgi:hypothetical protein
MSRTLFNYKNQNRELKINVIIYFLNRQADRKLENWRTFIYICLSKRSVILFFIIICKLRIQNECKGTIQLGSINNQPRDLFSQLKRKCNAPVIC